MDPQLAETTIKTYLNEIRNRLDKAAGIGRAADACAGAGFHEKGRHRNKTTIILGAASVPVNAQTTLFGAVSASEAPSPECVIKGNVNRKGERIYHLPGQLNYAQINMTKGLGERWFCTEAEADAAGW